MSGKEKPKTLKQMKSEIRQKLETDNNWLIRGLLAIYDYQTQDEQDAQNTHHHNGVGFNGRDANFLSSLAEQCKAGRELSEKQIKYCRKSMLKYSGQLARMAKTKTENEYA